MDKRNFPENKYVDLQDIPEEKRSSLVLRGWKKTIVGVFAVIISVLFIGALLLFLLLLPKNVNGSSEFQAWTKDQEGMIEDFRSFIESPHARKAGLKGITIWFDIPGEEELEKGAFIFLRDGFSEVMKVFKNMAPPKKKAIKKEVVIG